MSQVSPTSSGGNRSQGSSRSATIADFIAHASWNVTPDTPRPSQRRDSDIPSASNVEEVAPTPQGGGSSLSIFFGGSSVAPREGKEGDTDSAFSSGDEEEGEGNPVSAQGSVNTPPARQEPMSDRSDELSRLLQGSAVYSSGRGSSPRNTSGPQLEDVLRVQQQNRVRWRSQSRQELSDCQRIVLKASTEALKLTGLLSLGLLTYPGVSGDNNQDYGSYAGLLLAFDLPFLLITLGCLWKENNFNSWEAISLYAIAVSAVGTHILLPSVQNESMEKFLLAAGIIVPLIPMIVKAIFYVRACGNCEEAPIAVSMRWLSYMFDWIYAACALVYVHSDPEGAAQELAALAKTVFSFVIIKFVFWACCRQDVFVSHED